MSKKILVTYASRTGSTTGVAEAIAKTLTENGAEVDLLPMQEVKDVTQYRAVVADSAVQSQQWLPEAMGFMRANQAALRQKPFAMFSVCMTLAMRDGEKYRPQVVEWLAPVRAMVHPVSEGLFAGVLDIQKIPSISQRLKFHLSVATGVWSEGDHRDWEAIHDWAGSFLGAFNL